MNKEKALKNQGLEFREDIRKEGGGTLNHAPLKTAYSSGSKSISSISKPKIILISASLIRPFNSISTTI